MKEITVPLTNKLIAVLDKTKSNLIDGCKYGIAMAERKKQTERISYWQDEIDEIQKMDYEELHELFIDVQYRKITA